MSGVNCFPEWSRYQGNLRYQLFTGLAWMNKQSPSRRRAGTAFLLLSLFLLALAPRLYSAITLGQDWDAPGSFTLINFDEGGSCRAALGGFDYSGFIGRQTIAIDRLLGGGPDPGVFGQMGPVKAYCHGAGHIRVARVYSAVSGALTVVLLTALGLVLVPRRPAIAWTAGGLLAVSGFHISQSQSATVDAPSSFFIYLFLLLMAVLASRRKLAGLVLSPLLLVPAVWTKYWVFAVFAYLAFIPEQVYRYLTGGMSTLRVVLVVLAAALLFAALSNSDFHAAGLYPVLALFYLVIPWRSVPRPMIAFWLLVPALAYLLCRLELIQEYTMGDMAGGFGTSYGAIGWHKWLRNLLNLPVLLAVGLGLPACVFLVVGLKRLFDGVENLRPWLCLLPLVMFALYMALVAPVTYYRHYLPLIPAAALVAAYGLHSTAWSGRRWFMVLFFAWPVLLAMDLVGDYHRDPRLALRPWYAEHPGARIFISFYVSPPAGAAGYSRLFRPEFAAGNAEVLKQADYLILSENWYDTAFANELNGPVVNDSRKLVKTRPSYTSFYRSTLEGSYPHLELVEAFEVRNFMPELLLHRRVYGTFQLFVGDIRISRVLK